ncbi:hypothetical protein SAMN05421743_12123 [Thalassobacillus cyri]|uniref:Spore coat protein W n=1 Tax=Thalassobacillus cyri TaxID=571932 RepID=A0A1H4H1W4_9BACI|nr:hypothetical protein [Thalassobacillus cyri]SEB15611.1 hypothetical protein SAMN05421743_12123 [Thalassobacillus cyri]
MSKKNNNQQISEKVIEKLVNTVLDRNAVNLDRKKISRKDREDLRQMVEELGKGVDSLKKTTNEG